MPELRFVLDTNVVVSAALLRRSISRQAFDLANSQGTVLLSWMLLAELNDVMSRPKFDRYLTESERLLFVALLVRDATIVDITEKVTASRDPKDDMVLEVALNGRATCIVSGDKALLVLHPFRNIPILTPDDFLHRKWSTEDD